MRVKAPVKQTVSADTLICSIALVFACTLSTSPCLFLLLLGTVGVAAVLQLKLRRMCQMQQRASSLHADSFSFSWLWMIHSLWKLAPASCKLCTISVGAVVMITQLHFSSLLIRLCCCRCRWWHHQILTVSNSKNVHALSKTLKTVFILTLMESLTLHEFLNS